MSNTNKKNESTFVKIWRCTVCRIVIILFTGILAVIFLISVLANPVLNWIVKPQIENSVNSSGENHLNIGGIDYSLFHSRVSGFNTNLSLVNSSDSSADTTIISAPHFSVDGINIFTLLFGRGYSAGNIVFEKPHLNIIKHSSSQEKNSSKESTASKDSSLAQKLVKSLPENFSPLNIGSLKINSAQIVRNIYGETKTIDSVKNISISISDIDLDKNISYEKDNRSLISSFRIKAEDIHKKMFGPGYNFRIESIEMSSESSELIINKLNFQPYISDKEFFEGDKYRRDRLIFKIPEIKLIEPDFIKFFNKNLFTVNEISVPHFHIEVFTNRMLPIDPNAIPKMPHELISIMGFKFEVEKFETDNSVIILESVMPEVERRAHLEITSINATISNISNTGKQSYKSPCIINSSGKLMNEGKLEIKLSYNLLAENLDFSYEGSSDEMQLDLLNSHLEVEDKIQIKSGKIIKANFSADVNNGLSRVNIIPLYQNLEIEVLKEESIEDLWLPTLLADIKIRESNPDEDGNIKSANVTYAKKPTDTLMDVIWLGILQGIGEVVGF